MNYENLANKILECDYRRSSIYQEGMIAVLKQRIDGEPFLPPYAPGTVEFDAYFAGNSRGHNEWRNALIEAESNRDRAVSRLAELASERRAA